VSKNAELARQGGRLWTVTAIGWAGHKKDRRLMRMLGKSVPPDTGFGRKSLAALEINDAGPHCRPYTGNSSQIHKSQLASRSWRGSLPFFLAK
jgi:hypothetical protein